MIWWMVCARTVPALAHHRRALPLPKLPSSLSLPLHGHGDALGSRVCVCVYGPTLLYDLPFAGNTPHTQCTEAQAPACCSLRRPFFPQADQANLNNARLALNIHQDMQTIHLKMAWCRPASHSGLKLLI